MTNLEASDVQLLGNEATANVTSPKVNGCFRHPGGVGVVRMRDLDCLDNSSLDRFSVRVKCYWKLRRWICAGAKVAGAGRDLLCTYGPVQIQR